MRIGYDNIVFFGNRATFLNTITDIIHYVLYEVANVHTIRQYTSNRPHIPSRVISGAITFILRINLFFI